MPENLTLKKKTLCTHVHAGAMTDVQNSGANFTVSPCRLSCMMEDLCSASDSRVAGPQTPTDAPGAAS